MSYMYRFDVFICVTQTAYKEYKSRLCDGIQNFSDSKTKFVSTKNEIHTSLSIPHPQKLNLNIAL